MPIRRQNLALDIAPQQEHSIWAQVSLHEIANSVNGVKAIFLNLND